MKRNYHKKYSYNAFQKFGTVYCPRCERDIQKGPKSSDDDKVFLKLHEAQDSICKAKPVLEQVYKRTRFDNHVAVGGTGLETAGEDSDFGDFGGDFDFEYPAALTSADVTNTRPMRGRADCVMEPIQLEETGEEELKRMDIYNLKASDEILNIQIKKLRLFEEGEITEKFKKIRTPKGKLHKKKWEDLVDLYSLGVDFNLSRDQKNEMLAQFSKIIERNGAEDSITIPKTWDSIDDLFACSYSDMFKEQEYEYSLPEEFFGRFELPVADMKPLAKMRGIALDVKAVLAEALLQIDPSKFAMKYKRDDGILGGFESGDDFRKISEDDELFDEHEVYGHPISLCITVRTDETTCNTARTETEQAVVISILNAMGDAYEIIFLGYAPIHKPYSDEVLRSLLIEGNVSAYIFKIPYQ